MQKLVDLVHTAHSSDWSVRCREAFDELFDTRYPKTDRKSTEYRVPDFKGESKVAFGALIHPSNPNSGGYGGMSFALFPHAEKPALVALVIGTQGLAPDEAVLARPGHARKVGAICRWLNRRHGQGRFAAWAKPDPVRIDLDLPEPVWEMCADHKSACDKYGRLIYAAYLPDSTTPDATREALAALLDLMFAERGCKPLKAAAEHALSIQVGYLAEMLPRVETAEVWQLLQERRFVVLQGPPGTGKTRLAEELLREKFKGHGMSIQFHPNISYEQVIGGLAPAPASEGLRFVPTPGFLMRSAVEAAAHSERDYLLHIDEINRADLAKVLGEAVFLLEPGAPRTITLPYVFEGIGDQLSLPENLYILGTMNSADRSIAIVDVAVRRRFAFLTVWPQLEVVAAGGCELMQEALRKILSVFVEHSGSEAFNLLPGHAYFLEPDPTRAKRRLKTTLAPLLEEYLQQGYVSGFQDHILAYLQWLESL